MAGPRSIESDLVRKGPLSQPAVFFMAALAALLVAYLFGYLPQFRTLLSKVMHSGHSNNVAALEPIFYGLAGIAAFLVLLALLRSCGLILERFSTASGSAPQAERSRDQFVKDAGARQISLHVAREGHHLLGHYYPHRRSMDLEDHLREELNLTDENIAFLHSGLLARTDRRETAEVAIANIVTVHDLLDCVEKALLHSDREGVRGRSTDFPEAVRLASESTERGRTQGARVHGEDDSSGEQFSGLHRRASDYTGPKRRATDNRGDPHYSGPHRRFTDTRRGLPLEAAAEKVAVETVDELNRQDPYFLAPRNKRPRANDLAS